MSSYSPSEMYTDDDLRDIIDNEGLGYAIESYVSIDRILEPKTKALWISAYVSLVELTKHLELDK